MYVAAKIAYDGSRFFGFARQANVLSVTQAIENSLKSVGIFSQILAAGRTDKGVHATGQIISFEMPDFWDLEKLKNELNLKLYPSIFVKRIWLVKKDFHPRFSAKMREYRYLFNHFSSSVWLNPYISREKLGKGLKVDVHSLNLTLLNDILSIFEGEHNFYFFCKSNADTKNYTRTIYKIRLYPYCFLNEKCLVATFLANGFLYSQIRLIMGAVLACFRGEIELEDLKKQLQCEKKFFWVPASPNGLYLTKIFY